MKPEEILHRQVAAYLRLALQPPTIWTCFPSGGGGRVRGAKLKAMGLQAGWPDLLVMHNPAEGESHFGAGPIVVGLELKAKAGRQTPEQREVQNAFYACRAWYVLCRSVEEVERCLRYCKIPLRATVQARAEALPARGWEAANTVHGWWRRGA